MIMTISHKIVDLNVKKYRRFLRNILHVFQLDLIFDMNLDGICIYYSNSYDWTSVYVHMKPFNIHAC